MIKTLTLLFVLSFTVAFADSGADLLLGVTGDASSEVTTETTKNASSTYKLDNPFLMQLFTEWKSSGNHSFDFNLWVQKVLTGKYSEASHLYSAIKSKVSNAEYKIVQNTQLYLLWELNLGQTFLNTWMDFAVSSPEIFKERLAISFDGYSKDKMNKWFFDNKLIISNRHETNILKLKNINNYFSTLVQAWSNLRSGKNALAFLDKLNQNDELKLKLTQTALLSFAREKKLADAAKLVKQVFEPIANATKNPEMVVDFNLMLARLLYQAGALEASEGYYLKIPEKSTQFLEARAERMWISLRRGDFSTVKGELYSLSSDFFNENFFPEAYLVGSISYLKLCQYPEVKKTLDLFVKTNKAWLSKINKELASSNPNTYSNNDFFVNYYKNAKVKRDLETEKLKKLAKESVQAALPAIGEQIHWKQAIQNSLSFSDELNQRTIFEIKRSWNNKKQILAKTIRKMRFVRIELLSQLRSYSSKQKNADVVSTIKSAPAKNGELKFPFDGVVMGDELFHLVSDAANECVRLRSMGDKSL